MASKRPIVPTNTGVNYAPRLHPLGFADLLVVKRAMQDVAPDWTVELHGICADEASLVLLPEDGDDSLGPSFLVSRETYGLRVDQVHWDTLTEIGVYQTMGEVVAALRVRLAFCGALMAPSSATVH